MKKFWNTYNCSETASVWLMSLILMTSILEFQSGSFIGVKALPLTMLVHENCPGTKAIVKGNGSTSNTALVTLPCGVHDPLPVSVISNLTAASFENKNTFFIVVAPCFTIEKLTSSFRGQAVIHPSRTLPISPEEGHCKNEVKECGLLVNPLRNILNLVACWMTFNVWTQVNFLYDHTLDMTTNKRLVRNFIDYSTKQRYRISFYNISTTGVGHGGSESRDDVSLSNLDKLMQEATSNWEFNDARRVVVIAEGPTVMELLKQISKLSSQGDSSDYSWLIFSSITDDVIDGWTPNNRHRVYFVDAPLKDLMTTVSKAIRIGEALAQAGRTCSDVEKDTKLDLPPMTISTKTPDYASSLIPPVENSYQRSRLIPTHIYMPPVRGIGFKGGGAVKDVGKLSILSSNDEYQLHGAHLEVATLTSAPFIKPVEEEEEEDNVADRRTSSLTPYPVPPRVDCPQPRRFEGFLVDLLNILSREMNFTYTIYEVCDKSYGSETNGTWNGMVGDVLYGYAHIGLANLGANYARSQVVSFPIISTSYGGAGIIFRRPPKSFLDLLSIFFLPFSYKVWICLLFFILVSAGAMYLTMLPRQRLRQSMGLTKRRKTPPLHLTKDDKKAPLRQTPLVQRYMDSTGRDEKTFWHGENYESMAEINGFTEKQMKRIEMSSSKNQLTDQEPRGQDPPRSFADSLWFSLTVLMQQGQEVVPANGPARIVFGTVWVASVVIYAAYTSNLVSYFTVNKMTLPFYDLDGLVASRYKFGTRTGSVYIDNMKASNGSIYQQAYAKLSAFGDSVMMPSYEAAINRTLEKTYAFIGDYVVLDYYQKKDCNLILLKQQLFESKSSFILPHGSPILPAVNHYMSLLSESGIMDKLRNRWWRAEPCADTGLVTAYNSIGFLEVSCALLIMGFGIFLAAAICFCEYACRKSSSETAEKKEQNQH